MHVGVCCRDVYSGSVMCTAVIMRFCVCIWYFWCFSAVTDVSVDYLTSFYNRSDQLFVHVATLRISEQRSSSSYGNEMGVCNRRGKDLMSGGWPSWSMGQFLTVGSVSVVVVDYLTSFYNNTDICACWIPQEAHRIHSLNDPQLGWMTWSMIEPHIPSLGTHIVTLLNPTNTTLLYYQIPNGITPCIARNNTCIH